MFLGHGAAGTPGSVPLHKTYDDFNDAVRPIGGRYFAELIHQRLAPG